MVKYDRLYVWATNSIQLSGVWECVLLLNSEYSRCRSSFSSPDAGIIRTRARPTLLNQTRPPTRPPQTWPQFPIPEPSRPISKALPRRARATLLTRPLRRRLSTLHLRGNMLHLQVSIPTSPTLRALTIRITKSSLLPTPPTHPHLCLTTTNPPIPATAIFGLPATGAGRRPATTGCPAHGLRHPTRARYGRPAIGDTRVAAMASTVAIGDGTSDSMVASTTASAMPASAIRADTGTAATSATTAPSTT
jgi:hypothetical protein